MQKQKVKVTQPKYRFHTLCVLDILWSCLSNLLLHSYVLLGKYKRSFCLVFPRRLLLCYLYSGYLVSYG